MLMKYIEIMKNYFHFRLRLQCKDRQTTDHLINKQILLGLCKEQCVSKTNLNLTAELIIWNNKYLHFNKLTIFYQVKIWHFNILKVIGYYVLLLKSFTVTIYRHIVIPYNTIVLELTCKIDIPFILAMFHKQQS